VIEAGKRENRSGTGTIRIDLHIIHHKASPLSSDRRQLLEYGYSLLLLSLLEFHPGVAVPLYNLPYFTALFRNGLALVQ
jgi:hypothetical protein